MKHLLILTLLFPALAYSQDDSKPDSDHKTKVGLYYFSADTAKLSDSRLTTSTGNFDLKLDPGIGISYDYVFLKPESKWDWSAGFSFDLGKKMKKSALTLGGTDYTITPKGSPTISILAINGNAIYKVDEKLAIPFGLSISRPLLQGESDEAKVAGGIGYQFGVEYSLDGTSILDIQYRAVYLTGQQKDGTDILEYGKGFLSGIQLGYKYSF